MYPCRQKSERSKVWLRLKRNAAVLSFALFGSALVHAEGADWLSEGEGNAVDAFDQVSVDTGYVLGVDRFDLDEHTEILGWQLNESWYFGRQDGEDSGLTLVWQASANQVSLSKDGVRLTRRF